MARNRGRRAHPNPAQRRRRAAPNTGKSRQTPHTRPVDPAIKNPALRKLIAGRTDELKPFEWERLGKALERLLEKVLYEHSEYSEVAEWVQQHCTYQERRLHALLILREQGFGALTLEEMGHLFGETPAAVRQQAKRLRDKLRAQFPDLSR